MKKGLGVELSWSSTYLACKKPVQYPAPNKPDIEAHICNPRTQEVEVGGSDIQGHSKIHNEFKAMLGYMRSCLQRKVNSL